MTRSPRPWVLLLWLLVPVVWAASEIVTLQRRLREVGRLRLGVRTAQGNPRKLQTFRFTSTDRKVIEAVAAVYGGEVRPWRNDAADADQWEVITDAVELPIILPPESASQHFEVWAKGYCTQRCDGTYDTVRKVPCDCDPDPKARKCKATTRLSVVIPTIRGLGRWRLDSHGINAGMEIPGAVELIEAVARAGAMVKARLRLEARRVRKLVDGGPKTFDFVVPVVDLDISVAELEAAQAGDAPAVGAGWEPLSGPVAAPAALSLDDQLAIPAKAPSTRRNAPAPIPATGAAPGGASDARVCSACAQPYGTAEVVRNPLAGKAGQSRFIHRNCPSATPAPEPPSAPQEPQGGPLAPVATEASVSAIQTPVEAPGPPAKPAAKKRAPGPLTHGQQGKIFALVGELWPERFDENGGTVAREELEEYRRDRLLALCAALGFDIKSRSEIDRDQAGTVIEALQAIAEGDLFLTDDGSLIDPERAQALDSEVDG